MASQALAPKRPQTLPEMLETVKPQIALALPKGFDPDRMVRAVLTAVQKTPKLLQCTPQSIVLSTLQAAQLGLDVDGFLGHAYLVPYWNKRAGKNEAQLQIGYRGFISLARRSGEISSISAEIVYENDIFSVSLGTERSIKHLPNPEGNRGDVIGAYAVVFYKDGFKDFEYMTKGQIEHIREGSKSKDDGPWVTHWEEMARKTPIRRLAKRLPLSPEDSALIRAAVMDEYHESTEEDEAVVPGMIEIDPVLPPQLPQQAQPPVSDAVSVNIGKTTTTIHGLKLRHQFSLEEMKPCGLKIDGHGNWTIAAGLTHTFLELCAKKKIHVSEVDEKGNAASLEQEYAVDDSDLPPTLFEDDLP